MSRIGGKNFELALHIKQLVFEKSFFRQEATYLQMPEIELLLIFVIYRFIWTNFPGQYLSFFFVKMEYHKTTPNFALIVYSALQHQQLGKHIHFHKYFRRNPKAQQVQSNHEKIKYLSMRTNWTMKLSQQMVMSNPKLRKNENNTAACVSFKKK